MDPPAAQYVTTLDGVSIAYGVSGAGRPLVFGPFPLSHVQLSWANLAATPLLSALSKRFRVIQYDPRGLGMSTRGLGNNHEIDHYLRDLDAVVEKLELDRLVVCAGGWGGHVAVRYAAGHPERVAALILLGCGTSLVSWRAPALHEILPTQDWELVLRYYAPRDQTPEDIQRQVELFKQIVNPDDYLTNTRALVRSGGIENILPRLRSPTLVVHARDFWMLPVEEAMRVARLANGRIAVIDGVSAYGDG